MKVVGTATASRASPARSSAQGVLPPGRAQPVAVTAHQLVDHPCPAVVAGVGVLLAGVAQPDREQVGGVPRRVRSR
ncbi:MAG: hypothetical protein R2695_11555 [Acidimicrobiales bacterium]